MCRRTSHQHYQDFHPEKWEINNTKRKYFLSPFRLLSNGTFLKGIVNSKTCLALNLIFRIEMKQSQGFQTPLNLTWGGGKKGLITETSSMSLNGKIASLS